MNNIISTINRNDLNNLLQNTGQNQIGTAMELFVSNLPDINTLEDLKYIDEQFYSYFTRDTTTKKFACSTEEIFERKTFSGCSDIGLAMSAILRMKGIPTIYIESANIEWIKDVQENNENKDFMRGHIFLEIYLNDKWYLYDPTARIIYDNYNYNDLSLPKGYFVFAKALNCHEIGVHSISDEKSLATKVLKNFDISKYRNPNYRSISLKNLTSDSTLMKR